MSRGLPLLLLSGLLAGCGTFSRDDELPSGFEPSHLPRPSDVTESSLLEQFAPTADAGYRLGPGDKLTLDVWGRAELSGPHTIGPDGRISIPMAGSLLCTDLSREEAEQTIATSLERYFKAVAVTLRVDEYASNQVSVLGNVRLPGSFTFATRPTLLAALSQAGGLGDLEPGVRTPRCSVIRGRTQIVWIDLSELLWHGNVSLNIPLQRDDVIYVPDGTGVMVYVLGEVDQPGVVHLTPGMALIDALALAGGVTEDAMTGETRVLRPSQSSRADIDFDELVAGDLGLDAELQEGDIIYVPTRKLEKWNYFWRKINPFAGIFQVTGQ